MQNVSFVRNAWEDNTGTESLANSKSPLMASRTKHIGIKYHWFQSMLQKNETEVNMIHTKRWKTDMFTTYLTVFIFDSVREVGKHIYASCLEYLYRQGKVS